MTLTIPVTRLSIGAPTGVLIAASDLAKYLAADDIIAQAHTLAEQIQSRAQSDAEHLQQYCDEARAAVREEGLRQLEEEMPQLRQHAVADTIQWLVGEHQLEQRIVERLELRLRHIMTEVFSEFYQQQSGARLLLARLHERIEQLAMEEAGTLRVNVEQFDELHEAFVTHPQLRVKPDVRLVPGEAVLDTPMVSLHLNLEEQLQSILTRLEQLRLEDPDDQQD